MTPPRGKNIELRIAQFERYRDTPRAMGIARAITGAKISNGLAVLARYREKHDVKPGYDAKIQTIRESLTASESAADVATLDGFEGSAARAYFGAVMEFNRSEMAWPGRVKHPATDPMNALLSLTYTLLMHELTALLEGVGLDPYLGFLHQVDYGRPSLALDLMEPFRHPIADRLVLTLVNRRILDASDFHSGGDRPGVFLGPQPMKRFFSEYETWMLAKETGSGPVEREGCGIRRFRERLKDEVEKLARALREGSDFTPYRFDEGPAKAKEAACSTSSVTI